MIFQRHGYERRGFFSNFALGFFDGIDSVLWCYAFAIIIFTGGLSHFLPLGISILLAGWACLSICVAVTSRVPVHMIAIDEQAVVILGAVAILLNSSLGSDTSGPRGLATMLSIMALTSLCAAIVFLLASRFQLTRLLELLPYPVVCGFMAGIGWLLFDAGVTVALDISISLDLWHRLQQPEHSVKLSIFVASGLFLLAFTYFIEKSWALPAASAILVLLFYSLAHFSGYGLDELRAAGWMFDIPSSDGGIWNLLTGLSPQHIDTAFIVSIVPQVATIVFLTLLAASMNLSAMIIVNSKERISTRDELKSTGIGNLICAGIFCPPGYTDAPASILYRGFGATSRWMPLTSSLVCLLAVFSGDWFIDYTPRVLIGATIFLFAFQLFFDWMYANVRSFGVSDYLIICSILATVVGVGFMQGILLGIILTVFLFVLRYSRIPPIQTQYSLIEQRSSVERSIRDDKMLERYGGEALIIELRGYLFFGTANTIRDSVWESIQHGRYRQVLLDLRRVTGIDVSAINAFVQIRQFSEANRVQLIYACQDADIARRLIAYDAVLTVDDKVLVFQEGDYAIEFMESTLLNQYAEHGKDASIQHHLQNIFHDEEKVKMLMQVMIRIEFQSGDFLFRQGDPDTGMFILESGSMSATIEIGRDFQQRIKKFSPGAIIGELSGYTLEGTRTASVQADSTSVLYYLNPDSLADKGIVHELVARTLGLRMDYMNRRLLRELV